MQHHDVPLPVITSTVMIKPLEWNNNVGLRMELYGCNPGNGATGFCFAAVVVCYLFCVKPRGNGRNIVGYYMLRPFAKPVACRWMLLCVVAQSLKPVQLFSQQHPTFLLFRDRGSVAQQCWIRLHSSSNITTLRMDYKDFFFPRCTAGPKLVRSCSIRLHTTANTHATTPNIVGATMLGVVAPVCTQPYRRFLRPSAFKM